MLTSFVSIIMLVLCIVFIICMIGMSCMNTQREAFYAELNAVAEKNRVERLQHDLINATAKGGSYRINLLQSQIDYIQSNK